MAQDLAPIDCENGYSFEQFLDYLLRIDIALQYPSPSAVPSGGELVTPSK